MMKVVEKVKLTAVNVCDAAIKKVVPVAVSASTALAVVTVPAFAAESGGTGGVDYTSISSKITDGFQTVISNCIDIATTIIPMGLGLLAVGKLWDVAKRFFTKSTSG